MRRRHNPRVTSGEWDRLLDALWDIGYDLDHYSPGDGITRYRLVPLGEQYFSHSGIFTALGRQDAMAQGRAFLEGWWRAQERMKRGTE
jgi:hypothetical protein